MNPDVITGITSPFLANGIIGAVCVVLGWIALKLWAKLERQETEHKVEIAAKDALIKELYDARVEEAKVGYEILKSNEKAQAAFLVAVNGRSLA